MTDEPTMVLGWRACHWIRLPIWLSFGRACVTEAAFLWKPGYAASALLGRLFRGTGLSIAREEVHIAERGTFGLNKNILAIRTTAGKQYRFQVDDVDSWLKALSVPEGGRPHERADS